MFYHSSFLQLFSSFLQSLYLNFSFWHNKSFHTLHNNLLCYRGKSCSNRTWFSTRGWEISCSRLRKSRMIVKVLIFLIHFTNLITFYDFYLQNLNRNILYFHFQLLLRNHHRLIMKYWDPLLHLDVLWCCCSWPYLV